MQHETAAIATKAVATGGGAALAYFGIPLEGLVFLFAAAIAGAVASLHWRPPAAGSSLPRVVLQVFAIATASALAAALLPYMTDSEIGNAPGGLLAGGLGLFSGALYEPVAAWFSRVIDRRNTGA